MTLQPITLEGRLIRLEPLSTAHIPDLLQVAQDQTLWQYMLCGNLSLPEQMHAFVTQALDLKQLGTDLPFAILHQASGRAIGCTRFRDISLKHLKLEVGGSWLALEYQRTGANLECKYLLLRHAFETLGMLRVQFKTDIRNLNSQRSLEKLGARQEGVLRRSAVMPDGLVRDTLVYSILDIEWGDVKLRLEQRLERGRTQQQLPARRRGERRRVISGLFPVNLALFKASATGRVYTIRGQDRRRTAVRAAQTFGYEMHTWLESAN